MLFFKCEKMIKYVGTSNSKLNIEGVSREVREWYKQKTRMSGRYFRILLKVWEEKSNM